MTGTRRETLAIRRAWKAAGGHCQFVADGNHGKLEGWIVQGKFRILHVYEKDSGVEVYGAIAGENLDELIANSTPGFVPQTDEVLGDLADEIANIK